MCIGGSPPKPKLLPDAPPTPEEPPKAPLIPEGRSDTSSTKQGKDSLRINLNPGLIL
jgi:hypothetical protein